MERGGGGVGATLQLNPFSFTECNTNILQKLRLFYQDLHCLIALDGVFST